MRPIEKHSIIEINNVTKDFGSVRALNGVSMQIKQGEKGTEAAKLSKADNRKIAAEAKEAFEANLLEHSEQLNADHPAQKTFQDLINLRGRRSDMVPDDIFETAATNLQKAHREAANLGFLKTS